PIDDSEVIGCWRSSFFDHVDDTFIISDQGTFIQTIRYRNESKSYSGSWVFNKWSNNGSVYFEGIVLSGDHCRYGTEDCPPIEDWPQEQMTTKPMRTLRRSIILPVDDDVGYYYIRDCIN
ncbi:MAG: hypothetical protein AAFX52_15755, partial [Pseudomonadota bacterium]